MIKFPNSQVAYEYKAKITNVVDGDTLDLLIDVGFNIFLKERVRLYGINTPETRTRDKEEKKAGLEAKEYVAKLALRVLYQGITIKTLKEGKYGRYLVMIYYYDGEQVKRCLNQDLIDKGFAEEYYGGKR